MKLRPKILAALALTVVAALAILYFATNAIVLGGFSDLENDQAVNNLERVEQAVDQEQARLDSIAGDWSGWDETYAFVQGEAPEYVEVNLAPDTFVTLHADSMLFFDNAGELVYGRTVDLEDGTELPPDAPAIAAIASTPELVTFSDETDEMNGVLDTPSGPYMVASRPILTSERTGPIVGSLVIARPLDERLLSELEQVTRLSLASYDSATAPTPARGLGPGSHSIEPQNSDVLSGYTAIADVNGVPTVTFQVDMDRSIYAEGQKTRNYMLIALVLVGIALSVLVASMMELTVLWPIRTLSKFVASVRHTLTGRARSDSRDEIGDLSRSINRMLDSLQQYSEEREKLNGELVEERERIAALNRSLEDTVAQRTADLEVANDELRERNRQLLKAMRDASTDGLTGLLNHRSFQEHIRNTLEAPRDGQLCVLMIDIDGFKQVNDALGHQEGDRILNKVADALRSVAGDKSVFRYGGDEFAVCADTSSEPEAVNFAERLRESVLAKIASSPVTVSIGVSIHPQMASSAEELIYQADAAMYLAKAAGKNRVRLWSGAAVA